MTRLESHPEATAQVRKVSTAVRAAAVVLRTAFLCILVLVTLRVATPQSETIWSVYETTGDLIRLVLGLAFCIWLVFELFRGPRDISGYKTWFYAGLFAVPFALVCLIAIW
jgi:hypothetical protein